MDTLSSYATQQKYHGKSLLNIVSKYREPIISKRRQQMIEMGYNIDGRSINPDAPIRKYSKKPAFKDVSNSPLNISKFLAEHRGGNCLSTEISSNKQTVLWECECGHQFLLSIDEVEAGKWYDTCKLNTMLGNLGK